MKYARIINSTAAEVFTPPDGFTLADCFHPDVAAAFETVPDTVVVGSTRNAKGVWSAPVVLDTAPPLPVVPAPLESMEPMDFYLAFTLDERIAIKASTDAKVVEFWNTYERAERINKPINPNSPAVQHGLAYLAQPTTAKPPGAGILASADRVAQILAGVAQ